MPRAPSLLPIYIGRSSPALAQNAVLTAIRSIARFRYASEIDAISTPTISTAQPNGATKKWCFICYGDPKGLNHRSFRPGARIETFTKTDRGRKGFTSSVFFVFRFRLSLAAATQKDRTRHKDALEDFRSVIARIPKSRRRDPTPLKRSKEARHTLRCARPETSICSRVCWRGPFPSALTRGCHGFKRLPAGTFM